MNTISCNKKRHCSYLTSIESDQYINGDCRHRIRYLNKSLDTIYRDSIKLQKIAKADFVNVNLLCGLKSLEVYH